MRKKKVKKITEKMSSYFQCQKDNQNIKEKEGGESNYHATTDLYFS